ncbi:MAG: DUF5309 family protein [Phycisphaerales bacterium]|nr:DUF5309 family protein [Phycisphaerales bacterium]
MNPNTTKAFGGVMYPEVAQQIFVNIAAKDAPLTAILLGTQRERPTSKPEINWYGQGLATRTTQINEAAGYLSTDTVLTVDAGEVFVAGDLIHVERTNELMKVVSVAGDDVTVVRSFGSVAAAALVDDDYLLNIGPAKKEGDTNSDMRTNATTKYTSYTQIFQRSVQLTGTLDASTTNTEQERARLRQEQMYEIARDMELAALYSNPGEYTTNEVRRSTSGIMSFATANVADANGTLTKAEFLDFLSTVFAKGSQNKIGFAGPAVAAILTSLWSSTERTTVQSTVVGLTFQRIATPWGNLDLIVNPHMTGTTHGAELLVVDPEQCEVRPLVGNGKDRRLKLLEDTQAKNTDAAEDSWFAELGFTWGNPDAHGILSNIDAAG